MRFIKKTNLIQDLNDVPTAVKNSALEWLSVIGDKALMWHSFMDVKKKYVRASQVNKLYVFNIKDYRLIVGISFKRQIVYYKTILSHSEYEEGYWKSKYSRSK